MSDNDAAMIQAFQAKMNDIVRRAVEAEREACAKLVEGAGALQTKPVCDALAAGIRARGQIKRD